MKCPKCGSEDSKVLESRLTNSGRCIRRRRFCPNCKYRYTTYEKEELFIFSVKKRDGRVEAFQREKTICSIQTACQRRNLKVEQIEFMVGQVEKTVQEIGEKIISSRQLGDLVLQGLYYLDKVSYIRFASVYKDFKNLKEFYSAIKSIDKYGRLQNSNPTNYPQLLDSSTD
jgi:transcriptional repressor NrdR